MRGGRSIKALRRASRCEAAHITEDAHEHVAPRHKHRELLNLVEILRIEEA